MDGFYTVPAGQPAAGGDFGLLPAAGSKGGGDVHFLLPAAGSRQILNKRNHSPCCRQLGGAGCTFPAGGSRQQANPK